VVGSDELMVGSGINSGVIARDDACSPDPWLNDFSDLIEGTRILLILDAGSKVPKFLKISRRSGVKVQVE
jgi:hypothetical protein